MKFSFKSFKGEKGFEEPQQNQQAKRKEQVRRAQKTHRERKEAYTRSLEQEVLQLRANETLLLEKTRRLDAEVIELKKVMAQHGIEPTASQAQSLLNDGTATASLSASDEEVFNLNIRITNTKQKRRQIQVFKPSSHARHDLATDLDQSSLSLYPLSSPPIEYNRSPHSDSNRMVSELDLTTVGMNFVLTLESPCLSHITDAPSDAETGHAFMASATLLQQCPQHDHTHRHPNRDDWQVPAVGIERLLQLSSRIPISNAELTPVQAWDLLRQHPHFASLDVARLGALMERLVTAVKCYGFGGVIGQDEFDDALFETLVVGRVF